MAARSCASCGRRWSRPTTRPSSPRSATSTAYALRNVNLENTPRGDFHFDHLGNVVSDIHIRRCERKDGRLVNTAIKVYPQVGQFWTYDEMAFLAQPVYSRDYPPAKNLE